MKEYKSWRTHGRPSSEINPENVKRFLDALNGPGSQEKKPFSRTDSPPQAFKPGVGTDVTANEIGWPEGAHDPQGRPMT